MTDHLIPGTNEPIGLTAKPSGARRSSIDIILHEEAGFYCPNCGDLASMPVPKRGESLKKKYCCSSWFEIRNNRPEGAIGKEGITIEPTEPPQTYQDNPSRGEPFDD